MHNIIDIISFITSELWAVVNNAGILVMSEAEYTSIEATRKVLDVNTLGAARVTQAFLPLLRQSKGRVVIVTSVAGKSIHSTTYTSTLGFIFRVLLTYISELKILHFISIKTIDETTTLTRLMSYRVLISSIQHS